MVKKEKRLKNKHNLIRVEGTRANIFLLSTFTFFKSGKTFHSLLIKVFRFSTFSYRLSWHFLEESERSSVRINFSIVRKFSTIFISYWLDIKLFSIVVEERRKFLTFTFTFSHSSIPKTNSNSQQPHNSFLLVTFYSTFSLSTIFFFSKNSLSLSLFSTLQFFISLLISNSLIEIKGFTEKMSSSSFSYSVLCLLLLCLL